MRKGDNIRLRSDGRYEARYIKDRDASGKAIYGYCYGKTYEEAEEKRFQHLKDISQPREMNLLILGAGSHGLDVYEIAKSLRVFKKIDFLDDDPKRTRAMGKWSMAEELVEEYPVAIVAVGDEGIRREWTKKLSVYGYCTPTLIHPTAFIPEDTEIGVGTVICARVTVGPGVKIGSGCIVTSGSTIPRNTEITDWGYFDFDKIIRYHEEYEINKVKNAEEDTASEE